MRAAGRCGRECRRHNRRDLLGGERFAAARPRRIVQHPTGPVCDKAAHPVMNVIAAEAEPLGDMRWADVISEHQDNPRPEREFLGRVAIDRDLRQLRAVGRGQDHTEFWAEHVPRY